MTQTTHTQPSRPHLSHHQLHHVTTDLPELVYQVVQVFLILAEEAECYRGIQGHDGHAAAGGAVVRGVWHAPVRPREHSLLRIYRVQVQQIVVQLRTQRYRKREALKITSGMSLFRDNLTVCQLQHKCFTQRQSKREEKEREKESELNFVPCISFIACE